VTQATFSDVSLFEYLGGFGATLQAKVFCSPYWQETCCREVSTPRGRAVRVSVDAYPPGGQSQTAMCRCSICGKWAPRDARGDICVDCWIEAEEEVFEQCLDRYRREGEHGKHGLVELLRRLRWRRPFSPQPRDVDDESPAKKETEEDVDEDIEEGDPPPVMELTSYRPHESPGERHWLADVLEIPSRPAPPPNDDLLAALLQCHLEWVARDSHRRAFGCSAVMLPDDEDKLQEEIAHFEETERLKARAKWQSTVNPRIPYRVKKMRRP